MLSKYVLLACLASTLYMTGVIVVVQVVHYPLFERVEATSFRRHHAEHARLDDAGGGRPDRSSSSATSAQGWFFG